jgi:hypothetical protein
MTMTGGFGPQGMGYDNVSVAMPSNAMEIQARLANANPFARLCALVGDDNAEALSDWDSRYHDHCYSVNDRAAKEVSTR